ncbi:hypothetical protein HOC35_06795 [Candidatus Woesearchaeota archaeon]|jgi:guanylate kinase|nr:hypothetical protein [Candidatus Woesearchaeota archaeon]
MVSAKRKPKTGALRNLAATIFQERYSPGSSDVDYSSIGTKNLFLLVGPVAAGKSTLLEYLTPHVANVGLFDFEKHTTRKTRVVLDGAHTYVPVHDFESKKRDGEYFFSYGTHYKDNTDKPKRVRYGLPHSNLERLESLDGLLTLTDPNSFSEFLKTIRDLDRTNNLVPILLTTSTHEHLSNRLAFRECSDEERVRRLLQAEPQWRHYNSVVDIFPHVILNDSPHDLLGRDEITDEDGELKVETYKSIDRALTVLRNIIHYYKRPDVSGVNVHHSYLDLVSNQFFGLPFGKLIVETEADRKIKFNQSFQSVGAGSVTHKSLLENAYIDGMEINEGVAYIHFNRTGYDRDTMKGFLEAFQGAIKGAGYNLIGAGTSGGLEFSLTDMPFTLPRIKELKGNGVFKIVLKYNGNSEQGTSEIYQNIKKTA